MSRRKSWKREIAAAGLALWAVVTVRLFVFTMDAQLVEALGTHYTAFSTSVWLYAGGVFGLHAYQDHKERAEG